MSKNALYFIGGVVSGSLMILVGDFIFSYSDILKKMIRHENYNRWTHTDFKTKKYFGGNVYIEWDGCRDVLSSTNGDNREVDDIIQSLLQTKATFENQAICLQCGGNDIINP